MGLVDKLIEGNLLQHAVAYAEEVRDSRPLPKSSERDDKLAEARDNPGLFDEFRRPMPRRCAASTPRIQYPRGRGGGQKPYAEGVLPNASCSWS
jgi:3-hydroxyacyl-CoA dehydrogenase